GTLVRDAEGKPAGVSDFRMAPMFDREGKLSNRKWEVDAEGLDVEGDVATVGFERDHRVAQFRIDPEAMKPAFREVDFLIPKNELRQNRGFETIVRAHPHGQHEGGLI